jgi:class 3 adenylate cyclase/tetratricopeptide (TPR) repeat protein
MVVVDGTPEYKQVTVLFADVVRSMDIAAAVGSERLSELMAELVQRSMDVVQRYGGMVNQFTGDGIMALFGAPVALEDHAIRACIAALDIQDQAHELATEVRRRDGVALRVRIGLNSGEVIAGEIGTGALGYAAIGERVGMAQRMESVAPAGGVMLSQSTARLVERTAILGPPEGMQVKGASEPVAARRLLAIASPPYRIVRPGTTFVGRKREINTITDILNRARDGDGCVVGVAGPAGIGKSRLITETVEIANTMGIEVICGYCESHTKDVSSHLVTQLLRGIIGIGALRGEPARASIRARMPEADATDLLLLDDLLGIADPHFAPSLIGPEARRRRLAVLIRSADKVRGGPALYVIEDAHWVDEVSERMLSDLLPVIADSSVVVVSYRPEYRGPLSQLPDAHSIVLGPLSDSENVGLLSELLGRESSVNEVASLICTHAAGNPFFAEEMVRDLAERGVLEGERGSYVCRADITEVSVPASLQTTIAARVDRLDSTAKRTLNAAAVIGSRFSLDLLSGLGIEPALDELLEAELIDEARTGQTPDYAFRHPLVRAVAYQSQLKSHRAQLHRRLAAAIEARDPESADENAALIASHLEHANEIREAYDWHMRAGRWSANRDIVAAQLSWEHACRLADSLPGADSGRTAMRIAPRALLCGSAWRVGATISHRFDELRRLCTVAGDKSSLAIGMAGLVGEHLMHGRVAQASRLASEYMALVESIGDPTLTVGAARAAIHAKLKTGEVDDVLRWSQTVIDLAAGDPAKGDFSMGSPLAAALAHRGFARSNLGLAGWRQDFDAAVAMARGTDPTTYAAIVNAKYGPAIPCGVLLPHDEALRELSEALKIAEQSGEDISLGSASMALGVALVHRGSAHRARGLELIEQVRDMCRSGRFLVSETPWVDVYAAREHANRRDLDGAIELIREAVGELFDRGQLAYCVPTTRILVETLLARDAAGDRAEAAQSLDRLAGAPPNNWAVRDVMLLRLRALLARTRGQIGDYRDFVDEYRNMAGSLRYEGHMAWAEEMK